MYKRMPYSKRKPLTEAQLNRIIKKMQKKCAYCEEFFFPPTKDTVRCVRCQGRYV